MIGASQEESALDSEAPHIQTSDDFLSAVVFLIACFVRSPYSQTTPSPTQHSGSYT